MSVASAVRPLSLGTRCQNPGCCEGQVKGGGKALLNDDERAAPCKCALCERFLCDLCAAGVEIPAEVFGEKGKGRGPNDVYDGFVCSEHFNEEWV